ncbi:MAG: hypothetical protein IPP78_03500 [Holophagaceae bacterium]|nr:hypothetical protein [Holophagaceae bacterium]
MLRTTLLTSILLVAVNARAQQPSAPEAAKTNVFEATAQAVRPGDSVGLRWDCAVAGKVRLDPGGLVMEAKGQATVKPSATTIYTLTEAKPGGAMLGRVEVRIEPYAPYGEPAKVCAFEASTHAVLPGEPVVLHWTCTGTAKVKLEPGGLELDGQSEITVTPLETTRYTITASNFAGGASRTVEVQVLKSPVGQPARVCAFSAAQSAIRPGEPVELHWECVGDSKVRLEPGGIELDGKDRITVQPTETTVYTLSAANVLGGSSRSLEIRVIPGLPERPANTQKAAQTNETAANSESRNPTSEARNQPAEPPKALSGNPVRAAKATKAIQATETIEPPPASSKAVTANDTKTAAFREANLPLAIALSEVQRAAAPPDRWTVRLVVSGSIGGLKVLAKHGGKEAEDLMVLPFVRKDGIRWWQACYGAFPSKSAALQAYAKLPEALRKALSTPLPLHLDRLPGDLPKVVEPQA